MIDYKRKARERAEASERLKTLTAAYISVNVRNFDRVMRKHDDPEDVERLAAELRERYVRRP